MKGRGPIKAELNKHHFRVAIFGSARIEPNDYAYKQVYRLAELLGQHGISVITGGGPGLMDAANRGNQAGDIAGDVPSIGLNIKLAKEQHPNLYLDIKAEFDKFSERLDTFLSLANCVVIAPAGGIGTLLELYFVWQHLQVKYINDMPIILIGDMWKGLLTWMKRNPYKRGYMSKDDFHYVYCVKNVTQAFHVIQESYQCYLLRQPYTCEEYCKFRMRV
ncbi:MAG: LOG family protein [Nanoarchaeota archaeon]